MSKFTDSKIEVKKMIYAKSFDDNITQINLYKVINNYLNVKIDKNEFQDIDYDLVKINKKYYDSYNLFIEIHIFYKEITK